MTKILMFICSFMVATGASAQDEVCQPFGLSDYRGVLEVARGALSSGEFHKSYRVLMDLRHEMRCLDSMVHPDDILLFSELFAAVSLMDQDEEQARVWAHLREQIGGKKPWGIRMPDAFSNYFENLPEEPLKVVDGTLVHPKGMVVAKNGAVLIRLEAGVEVPGFMQYVNRKGETETSYWQDGVRFRKEIVGEGDAKKAPGWSARLSPPSPVNKAVVELTKPTTDEAQANEKGWLSEADPKEWMPDCKWVGEKVTAKMVDESVVQINAWTYDVSKTAGEVDLGKDLERCHEYIALKRYERWRAAVKRAARVGTVTRLDLDSMVRALKKAANEVSGDIYRDRFLKALNAME